MLLLLLLLLLEPNLFLTTGFALPGAWPTTSQSAAVNSVGSVERRDAKVVSRQMLRTTHIHPGPATPAQLNSPDTDGMMVQRSDSYQRARIQQNAHFQAAPESCILAPTLLLPFPLCRTPNKVNNSL